MPEGCGKGQNREDTSDPLLEGAWSQLGWGAVLQPKTGSGGHVEGRGEAGGWRSVGTSGLYWCGHLPSFC